MALETAELKRVFKHKDVELEDVPGASLKEVSKIYSGVYPELLNTMPTYKDIVDGVEIYEFNAKVGLKG